MLKTSRITHLPALPRSCSLARGGGQPGPSAPRPIPQGGARHGHLAQRSTPGTPASHTHSMEGTGPGFPLPGHLHLPHGQAPVQPTVAGKALRDKSKLPLLQHTGNKGRVCCWNSPSSSPGSPPALMGEVQISAAPTSRAGRAAAERPGWTLPPQVIRLPRRSLPTAADTAASAIGTSSQRLLKATALLL